MYFIEKCDDCDRGGYLGLTIDATRCNLHATKSMTTSIKFTDKKNFLDEEIKDTID